MIVEALQSLRPGARWNLNGDTLAGLEWADQQQGRPTDAEIEAEAARLVLPTLKDQLSKRVDEDAERVRLRYINYAGETVEEEAEGLYAVCIQHEMDHLEGVLFIDHLSRLKRERAVAKVKKNARLAA